VETRPELLPITSSEAEFAKRHGSESLEAKFESVEIDYLDPHRPAVVGDDDQQS
jgi:hypothetical protein